MTTKKSKTVKLLEEILGGPITFGDMVWSSRLSLEMSQAELGEVIGVSRSYICDIEKGRRTVSPERAAAIAEALGMSPTLFVQQSIQDAVDRAELGLKVSIKAA